MYPLKGLQQSCPKLVVAGPGAGAGPDQPAEGERGGPRRSPVQPRKNTGHRRRKQYVS